MRHCWWRGRRHIWAWKVGLHRLFRYRYCTRCGWHSGMEALEHGRAMTEVRPGVWVVAESQSIFQQRTADE